MAGGANRAERRRETAVWLFVLDPLFRRAVLQWVERADEIRPLCADCDVELSTAQPPVDWLLAVPLRDDLSSILTIGLCPACSLRLGDDDALLAALTPRLRSSWPRLRRLDAAAFAAGGSA